MPALSGEPWRGLTKVVISEGTGNRRYVLSIDDVDLSASGDQATWDNDQTVDPGAGQTGWTLRLEWGVSGTPSTLAGTQVEVFARDADGGGQIGASWLFNIPLADQAAGSTTRTNFRFSSAPLAGSFPGGGDFYFGTIELHMVVRRVSDPANPVTDWTADSQGVATQPASAFTHDWARGYYRQRVRVEALNGADSSLSNVAYAGTAPATWAYLDPIFARAEMNRRKAGSISAFTSRFRKAAGGTVVRSGTNAPGNTLIDVTFAAPAGIDPAAFDTAGSYDWEVILPTGNFGGDSNNAWLTGVATGWTRISDSTMRRVAALNVDARIDVDSAARTSATDVVNFGFHTVAATFKLKNARNEFITSAHSASVRSFHVRSFDLVVGFQGTLASSISPDAAGLYTVPAVAYSGPTTTASRGTGPNGDTATHSISGRDKGIQAHLAANTNVRSSGSARLWALSDLLRLDIHPEKDTTLTKDTDPLVEPGSAESTLFVISADELYLYAYAADVNAVARSGIEVRRSMFKPNGTQTSEGEVAGTTASGADLGWVTTGTVITLGAPAGNWRARARVELNFTGASGNYGDSVGTDSVDIVGSKTQTLGVASAYTAHRNLALHIDDEVPLGAPTTLIAEYREALVGRVALDAAPTLRIYSVSETTGAETDELAEAAMTAFGTNAYKRTWTPSGAGKFMVEVEGAFAGGGVEGLWAVTVRPQFDGVALALHGVLASRM